MVQDKPSGPGLFRRLAARIGESTSKNLARPWVGPLARPWVRSVARPLARLTGQLGGVMLLRDATEALEVEDYEAAEGLFLRVLGMDASRSTRVMAYHGAVVSRLRLGRYEEAVRLVDDAFGLLLSLGGREALSKDDRAAHDALQEAREFGQWAVDHPQAAADLRQRERRERRMRLSDQRERDAVAEPEVAPLGQSSQWPEALQSGYRVALHGLVAAGLVAAAADQLAGARNLLRAALYVSRYDHRIERDVCWHLSRLDEELGMPEEADRHRARYERLNERVKQTLRRLRWTN